MKKNNVIDFDRVEDVLNINKQIREIEKFIASTKKDLIKNQKIIDRYFKKNSK